VSIVRIGLAETKNFAEGHRAIFGKKKTKKEDKPTAKAGSAKKKKPHARRSEPRPTYLVFRRLSLTATSNAHVGVGRRLIFKRLSTHLPSMNVYQW